MTVVPFWTNLGAGVEALTKAAEFDPALKPWVETTSQIACEIEEVAREIRAYRDQITFDPERLNQVEERLDAICEVEKEVRPKHPGKFWITRRNYDKELVPSATRPNDSRNWCGSWRPWKQNWAGRYNPFGLTAGDGGPFGDGRDGTVA